MSLAGGITDGTVHVKRERSRPVVQKMLYF
jgi:hypothetical protein